MTGDTPFEKKWENIVPHNKREKPDDRDPEKIYDYVYDRRLVDRGLFADFEDQGE